MGIRQLELAVKERCRSGTLTVKDALQFFDRLLAAKSPTPSIYSFNHLFQALIRMKNSNNHYAVVFSLFNRLTQSRRVSPSPNVVIYTMLIDYCTRMNRPGLGLIFFGLFIRQDQRGEELLCNMISRGTYPDVRTYNTLIDGLCKMNKVEKAKELLNEMVSKGLLPNTVTCNIIVDALCKRGDPDSAEKLLYDMLDEGATPDLITYNSVINGYSKLGCWKESIRVFKDMVDQGFLPDEVTYGSMMDSLCKQGQIKEAESCLI